MLACFALLLAGATLGPGTAIGRKASVTVGKSRAHNTVAWRLSFGKCADCGFILSHATEIGCYTVCAGVPGAVETTFTRAAGSMRQAGKASSQVLAVFSRDLYENAGKDDVLVLEN